MEVISTLRASLRPQVRTSQQKRGQAVLWCVGQFLGATLVTAEVPVRRLALNDCKSTLVQVINLPRNFLIGWRVSLESRIWSRRKPSVTHAHAT